MEKRLVYAAAIAVLAVGAVLALFNPWTPLGATLGSARVSQIGLHLAEGSQTYFMVEFSVDNPSRVPVVITLDEVTFLVNGTMYPSFVLGGEPVVLEPGVTRNIGRLVLLTGSPIGFQREKTRLYVLESSWVLEGAASSLGMKSSKRGTLSDARDWYYQIVQ